LKLVGLVGQDIGRGFARVVFRNEGLKLVGGEKMVMIGIDLGGGLPLSAGTGTVLS